MGTLFLYVLPGTLVRYVPEQLYYSDARWVFRAHAILTEGPCCSGVGQYAPVYALDCQGTP